MLFSRSKWYCLITAESQKMHTFLIHLLGFYGRTVPDRCELMLSILSLKFVACFRPLRPRIKSLTTCVLHTCLPACVWTWIVCIRVSACLWVYLWVGVSVCVCVHVCAFDSIMGSTQLSFVVVVENMTMTDMRHVEPDFHHVTDEWQMSRAKVGKNSSQCTRQNLKARVTKLGTTLKGV